MALRVCTQCGLKARNEEDLELFKKDSSNKTGRAAICKSCNNKKYAESARRNSRKHKLKSRYGMTIEEYDYLLDKQEGCCAICGTDDPNGRGRFHVDHNHETGEVRGLLCNGCNIALGGFKDSPEILLKARDYLLTNTYYGEE